MGIPFDDEMQAKMTRMLAAKLAVSPKTMSWVIDQYKEIEHVDDASVQRILQISANDFYHLAICGRPRENLFTEDLETFADRFSIPQQPLARLVRRVEAITSFREYTDVAAASLLAAARDIAEDRPEPYDVEKDETGSEEPAPDDEQ